METLRRAIKIIGTQQTTADTLGVRQSTLAGWLKREQVPAQYCAMLEIATGGQIIREELWPDDWQRIWPELVPLNRLAKRAIGHL